MSRVSRSRLIDGTELNTCIALIFIFLLLTAFEQSGGRMFVSGYVG